MSEQSFSRIFLNEFEVNDSLTRNLCKINYFVVAHLLFRILVKIKIKVKSYLKLSTKNISKIFVTIVQKNIIFIL